MKEREISGKIFVAHIQKLVLSVYSPFSWPLRELRVLVGSSSTTFLTLEIL